MSDPTPPGGIDVDRLMEDLERRVAARRAAGELDPAVLDLPFDGNEPDEGTPAVRLRLEVAYSSKPGVGRAITFAKRGAIRFLYHFLNDLVTQINGALARLEAAQRDGERALAREQRELAQRVARLEDDLAASARRLAALEGRDGRSAE